MASPEPTRPRDLGQAPAAGPPPPQPGAASVQPAACKAPVPSASPAAPLSSRAAPPAQRGRACPPRARAKRKHKEAEGAPLPRPPMLTAPGRPAGADDRGFAGPRARQPLPGPLRCARPGRAQAPRSTAAASRRPPPPPARALPSRARVPAAPIEPRARPLMSFPPPAAAPEDLKGPRPPGARADAATLNERVHKTRISYTPAFLPYLQPKLQAPGRTGQHAWHCKKEIWGLGEHWPGALGLGMEGRGQGPGR